MEIQEAIKMKIISVFANEDKKRVIHNFFSLTALQIASYVFPIITLPYLVRVLGPEKYGLIAFAQAFTGYFQILTDYGFNLSVTKQIAIERENKDKLNKIFSSVMLIKLTLFLISCLLMTIIVFSVNRFAREFKVYFYTMGMVLSQTLFPIWFFQGVEKMKYITLINVLSRLIFTTLVFVLVKSEVDYLIVPILNSLGMLIGAFISLYIIYTKFQIQFVIPKYADVIFQLKDGWHIFISTVAISLYTVSNSFVLGIFTNNTIVGYYSAAEKFVKAIQGLYTPVSQAIYPYISNLMQKSKDSAIKFISKIIRVFGIISFIISSIIFIFASSITHIILGGQYYHSIIILRILSYLPFIILLSNIFGIQTMLTLGFQRPFSTIIISASIINILLLFVLTPLFQQVGTAFSVLISEIFVTVTMFIYLSKQNIHLITLNY